ncbi:amidohydrolase [Ruminococcaceae bacterium OttesenSCG-928-D13]|nr:amidohydrolase [Ruminococcaceae bacterium OttesenSCG-928-D13]
MKAIVNGRLVTVTGDTYENGAVLIEDGKIIAAGSGIEVPADCQTIDAKGGWITPGFIDCHSHISLMEMYSSMPGMQDFNEMSDPVTPQVRAEDAFNPFDAAIAEVMRAGFTTCYTGPGSANVIGGTGMSFKLRGHTVEEMMIAGSEQMKFALGENPKRVYGTKEKPPITRMGTAALMRDTLTLAREYSDGLRACEKGEKTEKPKLDPKLQALVPVVRGEMRCKIHAHRADDIATAIRIAGEFGLDYTIEHATEGCKILDILKREKVTCIVGPLLMTPDKRELWDIRLDTPAKLHEAGIELCLTEDAASETIYLPDHIGIMIKHGLPEQAAFEAITINPARALKLDGRLGSIEPGKDADIAVFDGHPFSNMTSCVLTMIDGEVHHNCL